MLVNVKLLLFYVYNRSFGQSRHVLGCMYNMAVVQISKVVILSGR